MRTPHLASTATRLVSPRPRALFERPSSVVHLAIIHGVEGVEFATAARSPSVVVDRVLAHIQRCIADKLWPVDATRFQRLVHQGDRKGAIELYFASVGKRWDTERLWTGTAPDDED